MASRTTESPIAELQRQRRRHHRRRMHADNNYQRTIAHFSTFHIILGLFSAMFQMLQFTNQTIFSSTQYGLWCGFFFVMTGTVCLLLNKSRTAYGLMAMIIFGLISLAMALSLSSVSWIGMKAASYCEYIRDECEANRTEPIVNSTLWSESYDFSINEWAVKLSDSSDVEPTPDVPDITPELCDDILNNYICGYSIGLGKTMHSLLMLTGMMASMTSFVLATVTCSGAKRTNVPPRNELDSRLSIIVYGGATNGRPISPWEFPPPSKEPLPSDQFPDEPPPVYEQYELDSSSYL